MATTVARYTGRKLLYGMFLNSGVRGGEMQNAEYTDFNCYPRFGSGFEPCAWHWRLPPRSTGRESDLVG
jgi:hypothetical protein